MYVSHESKEFKWDTKKANANPAQLDTTDKSTIQEKKIRVVWLTEGQAAAPSVAATPNRHSTLTDATVCVVNTGRPSRTSLLTMYQNDTPDVARTFSSPGQNDTGSASPPPYTSNAANPDDSDPDQSTVSAATAAVASTVQLTYEELKAKLSQAEAKVASLQEGGGLRQRVKEESKKLPTTQEAAQAVRQGVEGVPVQIVALLCLLSFLLAYFFF